MSITGNDIFQNIDILSIVFSNCDIIEQMNFYRINKMCGFFKILCNKCRKEPILPISGHDIENKINCSNVYCYDCSDYILINDSSNIFQTWDNYDKLNRDKNNNTYVKCKKCKIRCFNSEWLYHHKINYCMKISKYNKSIESYLHTDYIY